jgi:hypothetical protein
MRKGFSRLSGIVRGELGADLTDGSLFIFVNKRRDRMKLMHFYKVGFWFYYWLLETANEQNAPVEKTKKTTPPCWWTLTNNLQSFARHRRFI